jgi:peptide/nickel transport system substrate-binding protein
VAAALDPGAIGVVCGRAAVPLQSFLPPGVWARREGAPILGGTRDAVKRLLADGGWPAGLSATLLVPDDAAPLHLPTLGETIQQALGAAGMTVQVRIEPASAVAAARQTGQHDLVLAERLVAGGDPHLLLFPLSTSETATKGPAALNFSFYRNPRLDDVLARASQLAFRPERLRLYQRAQAMLAEELPWVPIYVRLLWAVARPEVRGLRLHVTGFHRLGSVSIEPAAAGIR